MVTATVMQRVCKQYFGLVIRPEDPRRLNASSIYPDVAIAIKRKILGSSTFGFHVMGCVILLLELVYQAFVFFSLLFTQAFVTCLHLSICKALSDMCLRESSEHLNMYYKMLSSSHFLNLVVLLFA